MEILKEINKHYRQNSREIIDQFKRKQLNSQDITKQECEIFYKNKQKYIEQNQINFNNFRHKSVEKVAQNIQNSLIVSDKTMDQIVKCYDKYMQKQQNPNLKPKFDLFKRRVKKNKNIEKSSKINIKQSIEQTLHEQDQKSSYKFIQSLKKKTQKDFQLKYGFGRCLSDDDFQRQLDKRFQDVISKQQERIQTLQHQLEQAQNQIAQKDKVLSFKEQEIIQLSQQIMFSQQTNYDGQEHTNNFQIFKNQATYIRQQTIKIQILEKQNAILESEKKHWHFNYQMQTKKNVDLDEEIKLIQQKFKQKLQDIKGQMDQIVVQKYPLRRLLTSFQSKNQIKSADQDKLVMRTLTSKFIARRSSSFQDLSKKEMVNLDKFTIIKEFN